MSSKRVMTLGSLPLQPRASPRNDSWKRNKIQNRPKLTSTMFIISSTWCFTRSEMKTLGLYGGKSRDGGVRGALYSYCSRHAYRCPITPSLPPAWAWEGEYIAMGRQETKLYFLSLYRWGGQLNISCDAFWKYNENWCCSFQNNILCIVNLKPWFVLLIWGGCLGNIKHIRSYLCTLHFQVHVWWRFSKRF